VYTQKKFLHSLLLSVIIILSIVTYLNCFQNQFVYDDNRTLVDNHFIFIEDWNNITALFTQDYFANFAELTYRPVVTISYFIDYSLWHSLPRGYHFVNVLLHTGNAVLLYFFLISLPKIYGRSDVNNKKFLSPAEITHAGFAFLTCILFVTHPVLSETVNAISYREDLFATLFLLASFLFFLRSVEKKERQRTLTPEAPSFHCNSIRFRPFHKKDIPVYFAAMTTYLLALLSKESAIVLPALILAFSFFFSYQKKNLLSSAADRFSRNAHYYGHSYKGNDLQYHHKNTSGKQKQSSGFFLFFLKTLISTYMLGYIGVSILYLILRFIILHNPQEKIDYPGNSAFTTFFTTTKVVGRYISNLFLPVNLNVDYHVLHINTPLSFSFILPFLLIITIVVITIRLGKILRTKSPKSPSYIIKSRGHRFFLFATCWFFIALLPVINIIPLTNIMADRYLYLPIIGFCIFISTVVTYLKRTIKYALIIPFLIFCIAITITRNTYWRNEFTLWYSSSKSSLCSFTTYNNLGTQYNKKGYPDIALKYFEKAREKSREVGYEEYPAVYYNMGNVYKKKNMFYKAMNAYKKAIQRKQDYKQAHNNLGEVYFALGQYNKTLNECKIALAIDPDFASAHNNLGVVYNKMGMQEQAFAEYKSALKLDPQNGDAHYNLGNIYEVRGQFDLALKEYQSALHIDQTQVHAHNNLGTIYEKKWLLDKAIEEYRHAIKHAPSYPYSHNNLGSALAKRGNMDGAQTEFQKAVSLNADHPDFHFNLGYIHLKKGNFNRALQEFKETVNIAPSHKEALFHMGFIYYKQGNKEKAMKLWKKVKEIDPYHSRTNKYMEMVKEEG